MCKKELVKTDSIRYKIYNFFVKLFSKNKNEDNDSNEISIKKDKQNFEQSISCRNEIIKLNRKKELAQELIRGNISIEELSDIQVDEMTEYFDIYINEMNQKLNQVKNTIINLMNNK